MANCPAPALVLRPGDREELERWTRASTVPASAAKRARIVLLAADGLANTRIAELVDATVTTVLGWRNRYQARGLAGLADAPRPGRPRTLDHRAIVAETLKPPLKKLGVTHWSSRLLAPRLGVDHATIAAVWKEYGVKPWKAETFKFCLASLVADDANTRDVALQVTFRHGLQVLDLHFQYPLAEARTLGLVTAE